MHLNNVHQGNRLFKRAKFGYESFIIKHYGGDLVEYDARGMVSGNMSTASFGDLAGLFEQEVSPVLALLQPLADALALRESYEETELNQRVELQTLSQQRRREIASLAEVVEGTELSFVHCIVPCAESSPGVWSGAQVLSQIKYAGMTQLCQIRNSLFSRPYSRAEVVARFSSCARDIAARSELQAEDLLCTLLGRDSENRLWVKAAAEEPQNRVFFLSVKASTVLERTRARLREDAAVAIQYALMQFLEKVAAVAVLQRFAYKYIINPSFERRASLRVLNAFRMFRVRNDFVIVRRACVRIQSVARLYLSRRYDIRVTTAVTRVQRVWRGSLLRKRKRQVLFWKNLSGGSAFPEVQNSGAVARTSIVVVPRSSHPAIGRHQKHKRELVLTAWPKPHLLVINPMPSKFG
jgi:hypothetical protein